ncbi:MAG TPA: hypothetical protein VHK69_06735 [Chitinophagaceae bacterium]|jgi:hypothetical protein|nr:hypothetical protein [Chitinophagaceae bacterium]
MKSVAVFLAVFCSLAATAQSQRVQIIFSRPYAVLHFLEAATGSSRAPVAYTEFIQQQAAGDSRFIGLLHRYRQLNAQLYYAAEGFPPGRPWYRSSFDLLVKAAVASSSNAECIRRASGILPREDLNSLLLLLNEADGYYETFVWKREGPGLQQRLAALRKKGAALDRLFHQFNRFYASGWLPGLPLLIALYPVPGTREASSATPHVDVLSVGIRTGKNETAGPLSIALHELAHTLYAEQPRLLQQAMENWFLQHPSPYRSFAYAFLDEGLATALGNGYSYRQLSGKMDTAAWYDNPYINGFGKALYPLAADYLENGRTLDSSFADSAIRLFAARFPKARYDYAILLNRVSIYADAENAEERRGLIHTLGAAFQLTGHQLSTPVLDASSLDALRTGSGTQLVVVDRKEEATWKALQEAFPAWSAYLSPLDGRQGIVSFYDDQGRALIFLKGKPEATIKALRNLGFMDPERAAAPLKD